MMDGREVETPHKLFLNKAVDKISQNQLNCEGMRGGDNYLENLESRSFLARKQSAGASNSFFLRKSPLLSIQTVVQI